MFITKSNSPLFGPVAGRVWTVLIWVPNCIDLGISQVCLCSARNKGCSVICTLVGLACSLSCRPAASLSSSLAGRMASLKWTTGAFSVSSPCLGVPDWDLKLLTSTQEPLKANQLMRWGWWQVQQILPSPCMCLSLIGNTIHSKVAPLHTEIYLQEGR